MSDDDKVRDDRGPGNRSHGANDRFGEGCNRSATRPEPSPEAVKQARDRIVARHRRWGAEAEDIASEAIARALPNYDPGRGALFSTYAARIAGNVAKEWARRARADLGEAPVRPRAAEQWTPLLDAMEPKEFALWFATECDAISAAADLRAGVEHAALSTVSLLHRIAERADMKAAGIDLAAIAAEDRQRVLGTVDFSRRNMIEQQWSELCRSIIADSTMLLAKAPPANAADVLRAALAAAGIKGQAFDRWLCGVRERRRTDKHFEHVSTHTPTQALTLQSFLRDHCGRQSTDREPASSIRRRYETLCEQRNEPPISAKEFGMLLASLQGVTRVRTENGNEYRGVGKKRRRKKM